MNAYLSLDPSSKVTGAVVGVTDDGPRLDILHKALLEPSRKRAPALDRAESMAAQAVELVERFDPQAVIVEVPAPQAPARLRNPRGQASYGLAVGVIITTLEWHWETPVHPVPSDLWTRRVSKRLRRKAIACARPRYDPTTDPGGDIADAIGLLEWWVAEQWVREVERTAAVKRADGARGAEHDDPAPGGRADGRGGDGAAGAVLDPLPGAASVRSER